MPGSDGLGWPFSLESSLTSLFTKIHPDSGGLDMVLSCTCSGKIKFRKYSTPMAAESAHTWKRHDEKAWETEEPTGKGASCTGKGFTALPQTKERKDKDGERRNYLWLLRKGGWPWIMTASQILLDLLLPTEKKNKKCVYIWRESKRIHVAFYQACAYQAF